jgi:hypothetical protein
MPVIQLLWRWRQKDLQIVVSPGNVSETPMSQPKHIQKFWMHGSSGTALAKHTQGPGPKVEFCKNSTWSINQMHPVFNTSSDGITFHVLDLISCCFHHTLRCAKSAPNIQQEVTIRWLTWKQNEKWLSPIKVENQ